MQTYILQQPGESRDESKDAAVPNGAFRYSVTMNVYTHINFDDAEEELRRMEEFRKAQAEVEKKPVKAVSQMMFKVV